MADAGRAQLHPRDRLEVARDQRVADAVALPELLEHLGHVRRDVVAEVARERAARTPRTAARAQVAQPLVDALGADAGERQDRARDREVRAPRGLDLPVRDVDPVDALDRRVDRLRVLQARLQQQRPVDVPEQKQHPRGRLEHVRHRVQRAQRVPDAEREAEGAQRRDRPSR